MKTFVLRIFLSIILLVSVVSAHCQPMAKVENVKISSEEMKQERNILIYTPALYEQDLLTYYDVIYVFDSQSREIFDLAHSLISFLSDGEKSYIVVGIVSPYIEELNYTRNNDYLPYPVNVSPADFYNGHFGGADNLIRFMKNELVPYVESNYRTKEARIAVGHSLSASFSIYSFLKEPSMFDAIVAVSPNFAYDKERLANDFMNFDFQKIKSDKYFYICNADEGTTYWEAWKPAYEKVYAFLRNGELSANIGYTINEFPTETHWSVIAPALIDGLKGYFQYRDKQPLKLSSESYQIDITVVVPDKNDDVYIVGNQTSLGDWQANKVKLLKVSDLERKISLNVKLPVEFKFTRGDWSSEAQVKYNEGMDNIWVNPKENKNFRFEILNWTDRE